MSYWFMPRWGEAMLHVLLDGEHGERAACGLPCRVKPAAIAGQPVSRKCPRCLLAWQMEQERAA